MNEFTKEELQILSEYLDYPIEEIAGCEGNRLQLVLKIESMIDNYKEPIDVITISKKEYDELKEIYHGCMRNYVNE